MNPKLSFITYPFEWQEKSAARGGSAEPGVLIRAGSGGHDSACGETCALPRARVSGLLDISVFRMEANGGRSSGWEGIA